MGRSATDDESCLHEYRTKTRSQFDHTSLQPQQLQSLSQEDCKFRACLGYSMNSRLAMQLKEIVPKSKKEGWEYSLMVE